MAYEALRASGKPSPLDREPDVRDDLIPMWRAFEFLSSFRSSDNGMPQPIAFHDALAYARIEGRDDLEAMSMTRILRNVDAAYRKWWAQRLSRKAKQRTDRPVLGVPRAR